MPVRAQFSYPERPPRAGRETIGSSNRYLYELPSSDQLFVMERGYGWNGLFTYKTVLCIKTQRNEAVCMMDAYAFTCVYADVFP